MVPPTNQRSKQLAAARQSIGMNKKYESPKVDTDLFVLSTLMEGSTYSKEKRRFNSCGIECCSSATFYRKQPVIAQKIIDHATTDMIKCQNNVKENARLAGDSRYSHRTHSTQNTYVVLDNDQNKVIAVHNTVRNGGKRTDANFTGPCNQMESEGARNCVADLQKLPIMKAQFAHDNDNKTTKILQESNRIELTESLDRNHAVKAIERRFNNFFEKEIDSFNKQNAAVSQFAKGIPKDCKKDNKMHQYLEETAKDKNFITKKCINPLRTKLVQWFLFLVTFVQNIPKRVKLWLNSAEHWTGNHVDCHHDEISKFHEDTNQRGRPKKHETHTKNFFVWQAGVDHPELKQSLTKFLNQEINYVSKVSVKNTTQTCESLNSAIARTAPKSIAMGNSYSARVFSAVGTHNNPHFRSEMVNIVDKHNRVSPSLAERIWREEEKAIRTNEAKRFSFFRNRKNLQRRNFRNSTKPVQNGDYHGH